MKIWAVLLFFVCNISYAEIGSVVDLSGTAIIKRGKNTIQVSKGTNVETDDKVETKNGAVNIRFKDNTTVKVTENSSLVIDDFVYSGKPSTSKMALKFASGTVRFATGQTGKMDKANINLQTPTATVAVRGTDFASTVDDFGKSLIILLPEEDGTVGEITVSNAAGTVTLTKAFQATMVATMDTRPSKPVILSLSLDQIDNMLIVSPPKEDEKERDVEDKRANILDLSELDIDYLKDNSLNEDNLADSDLAIDALRNDYLGENYLTDTLSGNVCTTKENTKICGTGFGYDPSTQITTIMSGDYLRFVRSLTFVADIKVNKDEGKTILININGKPFLIEVNDPAGGTKININQSN